MGAGNPEEAGSSLTCDFAIFSRAVGAGPGSRLTY